MYRTELFRLCLVSRACHPADDRLPVSRPVSVACILLFSQILQYDWYTKVHP